MDVQRPYGLSSMLAAEDRGLEPMSRYEMLRAELGGLRMRQAFAVMVPAIAIAVFTVPAADSEATMTFPP